MHRDLKRPSQDVIQTEFGFGLTNINIAALAIEIVCRDTSAGFHEAEALAGRQTLDVIHEATANTATGIIRVDEHGKDFVLVSAHCANNLAVNSATYISRCSASNRIVSGVK